MTADGETQVKRGGFVEGRLVAALILALPIALVIVMTLSPFRDAAKVEPEEEPPRPKVKGKSKAEVAPPPREVIRPKDGASKQGKK